VRADRAQLLAQFPFRIIPKEQAAKAILRGVCRNRPVIVFPWEARLVCRLYRWFPWAVAPLARKACRDVRRLRQV
jgi:hypothetical protein